MAKFVAAVKKTTGEVSREQSEVRVETIGRPQAYRRPVVASIEIPSKKIPALAGANRDL